MAVSKARVRKLALSLEGATEVVHVDRPAFRTARKIFPTVDKANDEPSADLLTQRMQVHEKNAWMLRSLLA